MGKQRKVDSPKKKKVEKLQDGRQKSSQNIGNPYQMEDNKAAPNPKGGAGGGPPGGVGGWCGWVWGVMIIFFFFFFFLGPTGGV